MDFESTYNPYRFYGLVASGCTIGINMIHSRAEEFHGASAFGNTIDVWLSGFTAVGGYVLFDGAQFGSSGEENMYLDQRNEPLICAANCYFTSAWQTACPAGQSCGAIEIGPDAKTKATQQTPIIAQFNQGLFASAQQYDVAFDTNTTTGKPCNCRVAMGSGMIDEDDAIGRQPGRPHHQQYPAAHRPDHLRPARIRQRGKRRRAADADSNGSRIRDEPVRCRDSTWSRGAKTPRGMRKYNGDSKNCGIGREFNHWKGPASTISEVGYTAVREGVAAMRNIAVIFHALAVYAATAN